MLRSSQEPELAAKLLKFIDLLQSGADAKSAADAAELDRETTVRFLEAIKEYLLTQAKSHRRRPGAKLRLVAVCDGASRGNPGQAACAVILTDADDGQEVLRRARTLGVTTNNVAEYEGVILALELAQTLGASEVLLKLDSELVVKQLNHEYKVKHASLKPLFHRVQELGQTLERLDVVHVGRDETQAADKMANDALDGKTDA